MPPPAPAIKAKKQPQLRKCLGCGLTGMNSNTAAYHRNKRQEKCGGLQFKGWIYQNKVTSLYDIDEETMPAHRLRG